jgi:hypothetical protein
MIFLKEIVSFLFKKQKEKEKESKLAPDLFRKDLREF